MSRLLVCLLCLLPATASAGTGSNYTIFGIGDIRLSGTVRNNALGYSGIAIADGMSVNLNSPATWSKIIDTRIEGSILHEAFTSTGGNKSLSVSETNFNGASMAVPISTKWGIVVVGSMTPYSNKDYNVFTTGSQQGMDYVLNHEGKGGLGRGRIGMSFAPFSFLSVGASFDYVFGSLENSRTLLPTSLDFAGGVTTGTTGTNGITGTFGAVISGPGLILPFLKQLSLGVVFTNRTYLKTDGDFLFEYTAEADTLQIQTNRIVLPLSYGVGASYKFGSRLLIAADLFTQEWGTTNLDSRTRDMRLYSAGIEWGPSQNLGASFFNRISIRLGSYFYETYYVVNGQPIDEWAITGGLGVPFSGESRLNFAFEWGQRGTTDNNLIKEDIFRFSLGITIRELWFLSLEEE